MALIKCPACRADVSDRAAACVQCGHPLQATGGHAGEGESTGRAVLRYGCGTLAGLLGALMLLGFIVSVADGSFFAGFETTRAGVIGFLFAVVVVFFLLSFAYHAVKREEPGA